MLRKTVFILLAIMMTGGLFVIPFHARAEAGRTVDLTTSALIEDKLKQNEAPEWAYQNGGAGWVAAYSLFDMGSGKFLVYRIQAPAGQGVLAKVDYRAWKDVGNGGVHQYSSQPKTGWYVRNEMPSPFSGNVTGWTEVEAEEDADLELYSYTHVLLKEDTTQEDTVFYACLKFLDNQSSFAGRAGWNDGAWIDAVSFETITGKPIAVKGVSVTPGKISLKEGEGIQLKAVLNPANATNRNLTWQSSDPDVAPVSESGEVVGKRPGRAVVTVRTEEGSFTAECNVEVKAYTDKDIVLKKGEVYDTNILNDSADPLVLPMSWYYYGGRGQTTTRVVREYGEPFRDFGSYAYAIYKLKVPAGCTAQMLLKMRREIVVNGSSFSGILSGGQPRLQIYYASEIPLSHVFTNSAVWTRADRDSMWNAETADYSFTVSGLTNGEQDVYVMLYSTFAGQQGAWIDGLSFRAFAPKATELFVKGPTDYRPGEDGNPVLDGMRVAARYDDRSERILSPDEYSISFEQMESGFRVTVKMNDSDLTEAFVVPNRDTRDDGSGDAGRDGKKGCGSYLTGGTVCLLIASCGTCLLPVWKRRKGGRNGK